MTPNKFKNFRDFLVELLVNAILSLIIAKDKTIVIIKDIIKEYVTQQLSLFFKKLSFT